MQSVRSEGERQKRKKKKIEKEWNGNVSEPLPFHRVNIEICRYLSILVVL